MNKKILSIQNLSLKIGANKILSNISFDLCKNETLGIVGESGSGKSITALSILNLFNLNNTFSEGSINFNGTELSNLYDKNFEKIRGKEISIIFQEPMSSLNPSMKCGDQILEILTNHLKCSKESAKKKVLNLIERVQLKAPKKVYEKYPHELSGGQQQRVMIAIAIACNPKLLIADEPTTALDSLVKNEIISLIKSLQSEYKMSVIFISHDLNLVSKFVDKIIVLKNGNIVECGKTEQIFNSPSDEYTRTLINSSPPKKNRPDRLLTSTLKKNKLISKKEREVQHSKIYNQKPILKVQNINFSIGKEKILYNISFELFKGEVLGIVGQSGSGKSTIGKVILGLINPQEGDVIYKNQKISKIKSSVYRKNIQLIFQDPFSSLNPELSVGYSIIEPMIVHKLYSTKKEMKNKALELLSQVGLSSSDFEKYPKEFSGGQRQRIVIARALGLNPEIIVCDESVSALDVSIQAEVLNLLSDLKQKFNFTYIFISHDMPVIKYFTDRIIVLNNGQIVDFDETDSLFKSPKNTYTKSLLEASGF
ncbi:MAG: ABC transporter ATP-binding protein [Flavobacteriaceae bacterium]|nr:ABC transporter ATP-binding protein [Flavobacteriaceae bacterium]